jgi:hypothetical protein
MDAKAIEATLDLEVHEVGFGVPNWVRRSARLVFFPFYLVSIGLGKITGEEKWQREQVRKMVDERPPMSSDDFLSHFDPDIDQRLVLAVRHAFSQSTGLPIEAIHPDDSIMDLGRLQLLGFDVLDIVFRTEKIADRRIPGVSSAYHERRPGTVQHLATIMAIRSSSTRKSFK